MFRRFLIALLLLPLPGWSQSQLPVGPQAVDAIDPPEVLFGTRGSAAQCAAWRGTGQADLQQATYRIDRDWLLQGGIYCYLTWRSRFPLANGLEVHALAQCGEDTLREYDLVLRLQHDQLRLHWSQDFSTRPLLRCD